MKKTEDPETENGEILAAFKDYLESIPNQSTVRTTVGIEGALQIVREFAARIEPVPLNEATDREIRAFVADYRVPSTPMRPLPLSEHEYRRRLNGLGLEVRYHNVKLAMEWFREFRRWIRRNCS